MLRRLIEENFAYLKSRSPSEAKTSFGKIWAALASKRIRFLDGEIFMSWRPLSAELAKIYNEWFEGCFTTDAFIKAFNPETRFGVDQEFDGVIATITKYQGCLGIFKVKVGPSISAKSTRYVFSEINIITGEEVFYIQDVEHGRPVGNPSSISGKEFETFCYSEK